MGDSPQDQLAAAFEVLSTKNCVVDAAEGLDTLHIYINNLVQNPKDRRFRRIRISNTNFQERLGHLVGGQLCLNAVGFVESGDFLQLDERYQSDQAVAVQLLQMVIRKKTDLETAFTAIPRHPDEHPWSSVTAVGAHGEIGVRDYMEDEHVAVDSFRGEADSSLFVLFDGHGGRGVVEFVSRVFHLNLAWALQAPGATPESATKVAYLTTDGQLRRRNILQSGSTVVSALKLGAKVYVGNAGDSRAVLCRSAKAERLTRDHKPTDEAEAERIVRDGGFIGRFNRVNGILAVSRALGDHMLKPAVSAEPEQTSFDADQDTEFVILACDGLWDVLSDQEAVDFVRQHVARAFPPTGAAGAGAAAAAGAATALPATPLAYPSKAELQVVLHQITKDLIQEAFKRKSQDNVSILIVWL